MPNVGHRVAVHSRRELSHATEHHKHGETPTGFAPMTTLYSAVGEELTHYTVDPDGGALSRQASVTLPADVQYAWPHPSGGATVRRLEQWRALRDRGSALCERVRHRRDRGTARTRSSEGAAVPAAAHQPRRERVVCADHLQRSRSCHRACHRGRWRRRCGSRSTSGTRRRHLSASAPHDAVEPHRNSGDARQRRGW